MNPGLMQVYTGDGKGKTTAALGLCLRALGAGWRVCLIQFMKGRPSSEQRMRSRLPGLTWRRFGNGQWVRRPTAADLAEARKGLAAFDRALRSGRYALVVGDELCTAVACGLLKEDDVLKSLQERPPQVEVVVTGRGASPRLLQAADLVTEMRCRKHYFQQGVPARKGIEY